MRRSTFLAGGSARHGDVVRLTGFNACTRGEPCYNLALRARTHTGTRAWLDPSRAERKYEWQNLISLNSRKSAACAVNYARIYVAV